MSIITFTKDTVPDSSVVVYKGSGYKLSSWKSAGFDSRGIEADPRFSSISSKNFTLTSSSPALNKGVNLSSPFNVTELELQDHMQAIPIWVPLK
jgi:hypothetical protein